MRVKFMVCITLLSNLTYAIDPSDAALKVAKKKGNIVYTSCVLVPPVTDPQKAYCLNLYNNYIAALENVASPTPISINTNPSMTSWSPYDPCRYDAAVFVYTSPSSLPYCPST
jgi:hypothetical protein